MLDCHTSFKGLRHRTPPFEDRESPFGVGALSLWDFQIIPNSDMRHLHDAGRSRDSALRLSLELVGVTWDSARFQRAREGPG